MKYLSILTMLLLSTSALAQIEKETSTLVTVVESSDVQIKNDSYKTIIEKEFRSWDLSSKLLISDWEGYYQVNGRYLLAEHFYVNGGFEYIAPKFGFGSEYKVKQFSGGVGFVLPMEAKNKIEPAYYLGADFLRTFSNDQNNYSTNLTGVNFNLGLILANVINQKFIFTIDGDISLYEYELLTVQYDLVVGYRLNEKFQIRALLGTNKGFDSVIAGLSLKSTH